MGLNQTTAGASRRRPRLRREILAALAVKTALLAGLWWLFFAQAPSKATVAAAIGGHLASAAAPAGHAVTAPSSDKEQQP